jgi:hypothetical protein
MEMLSLMGRRRSNVIKGDFQLDFFGMVDHVAGDTRPYWVAQEDGRPNPSAEIEGSMIWWRQPRPLDAVIRRQKTILYPHQPGTAYCGGECADWKPIDAFPPRKRYRADGTEYVTTQPWCRACTNRHARKMYALQKEGYRKAA